MPSIPQYSLTLACNNTCWSVQVGMFLSMAKQWRVISFPYRKCHLIILLLRRRLVVRSPSLKINVFVSGYSLLLLVFGISHRFRGPELSASLGTTAGEALTHFTFQTCVVENFNREQRCSIGLAGSGRGPPSVEAYRAFQCSSNR
jgi:hypothetical protein